MITRDDIRRIIAHIEPAKPTTFFVPESERALLRAYDMAQRGAWADAIEWLGRAVARDKRLLQDASLAQFAGHLTGLPPQKALQAIADPKLRSQVIDHISYKPRRSFAIKIPFNFIFVVALAVILVGQIFSDSLRVLWLVIDDALNPPPVEQIADTDVLLLLPDGEAPFRTLIALPERGQAPDAMIPPFKAAVMAQDVALLVPSVNADFNVDQLGAILSAERVQQLALPEGVVLFGYGTGGEIASLYASQTASDIVGVATSGATFLYPPRVSSLVLYGRDDPLAAGIEDPQTIQVADLTQWDAALNYFVLDDTGREITREQITLIMNFVDDVYPN